MIDYKTGIRGCPIEIFENTEILQKLYCLQVATDHLN